MLTLTRKTGQRIRIGDAIEIVVREVRGRHVRLGIVAPPGLPIYREELYQQIAKANAEAAAPQTLDLPQVPSGSKAPASDP